MHTIFSLTQLLHKVSPSTKVLLVSLLNLLVKLLFTMIVFDKDVTSFIPSSLLPCLDKMLEKFVFNSLHKFLTNPNFVQDYQFGLGHSTSHTVVYFSDIVMLAFDKNDYLSGTLLDLSKAFDTPDPDHTRLLNKFQNYRNISPFLQAIS